MKCLYCNRIINNVGSLKAHETCCVKNPTATKHRRSSKSGAKKGTPSPLKGIKAGRNKKWDKKFPLEAIFKKESTYPRHCLKKRILTHDLIKYQCAICRIGPSWMGKPMPLILDHKNGINNDNRIENLRFVCSNCDTQLPTYKSKNKVSNKDGSVAELGLMQLT